MRAEKHTRPALFAPWKSVVIVLLMCGLSTQCRTQESLVNFRHLQHLTERIAFGGDSVDIVHIYANAPAYAWVDARESGPEGIACVDDAARAVVWHVWVLLPRDAYGALAFMRFSGDRNAGATVPAPSPYCQGS